MAQITGINALGSGFGSPSGTPVMKTNATDAAMITPVGGLTFNSLYVRVSGGFFADGPITVGLVRDGGIGTSLSCVVLANTQGCSDTTPVTIPAGSFVAVRVDNGGVAITGSAVDVTLGTS